LPSPPRIDRALHWPSSQQAIERLKAQVNLLFASHHRKLQQSSQQPHTRRV